MKAINYSKLTETQKRRVVSHKGDLVFETGDDFMDWHRKLLEKIEREEKIDGAK